MRKMLLVSRHDREVEQNVNIKFLKKKMKKLDSELHFMSGYLFRLRLKLNNRLRFSHE